MGKREENMNKKLEILKNYFGFDQFRTGQEVLIDKILDGKDVLGIMPTGGGKSLCFQHPAMMMDNVTIVISPLISLMKDQVDALNEMGIDSTFINSTLSTSEIKDRIYDISSGAYKIVYVAPERLNTSEFNYLFEHVDVDIVAVDEAHCISQWGHDFRPSYRNIPAFIKRLRTRPVVSAFTATATIQIVEEIKVLLELDNPYEITTGFDRPNLLFKVIKPHNKFRYLSDFLKERESIESGIIYCSTRKNVESLSRKLCEAGYKAEGYHGGMSGDIRVAVQDNFMFDKTNIIVATNAFGMGIDKPDVRYVVHYNMPKNMEAYYQEAGRAGRDGEASDCVLMYSPADIVSQKMLIEQSTDSSDRKENLNSNLQYLINYCHTDDCLRKEIVGYFGELREENCGYCGNCLDESEKVDVSIEAQKILSCVYRTEERYGINIIIQVLRGSKNKKVLGWRLDKVSTYGIMEEHTDGGVRELIMMLIAKGFLRMTTDSFPVLKLTKEAKSILKGEEKVFLKQERLLRKDKPKKSQRKIIKNLDYDDSLFELMVEKRREIAEEKGVPSYVIFHNKALQEMAFYMPVNKDAFLEIKGVGDKKYEHYGEQFIEIILKYREERNINDKEIKEKAGKLELEIVEEIVRPEGDRYELTYEAYLKHSNLKDIVKERGYTSSTIINHLTKCAQKNMTIDWNKFLEKDVEECILGYIRDNQDLKLKELKESLPDTISYEDIHMTKAKHNL